jgi:hypothetical protein
MPMIGMIQMKATMPTTTIGQRGVLPIILPPPCAG